MHACRARAPKSLLSHRRHSRAPLWIRRRFSPAAAHRFLCTAYGRLYFDHLPGLVHCASPSESAQVRAAGRGTHRMHRPSTALRAFHHSLFAWCCLLSCGLVCMVSGRVIDCTSAVGVLGLLAFVSAGAQAMNAHRHTGKQYSSAGTYLSRVPALPDSLPRHSLRAGPQAL